MWKFKVLIFAFVMLISGTINTVTTKYQDNFVVGYGKDHKPIQFQHPVFQSFLMFIGEVFCLFPFMLQYFNVIKPKQITMRLLEQGQSSQTAVQTKYSRAQAFRNLPISTKLSIMARFVLPTMCDVGATTLLNVGLFYTYASTFQMLRGTLVLFADFFTLVLLKRKFASHHLQGCILIIVGAVLVGTASVVSEQPEDRSKAADQGNNATNPVLGDILIVIAQALQALQIIIEEKFLKQYQVPGLAAVGMEGIWGVTICLVVFTFSPYVSFGDGPVDNLQEALSQTLGRKELLALAIVSIFAIGFFNYSGISVTRNISGAARSTIDQCRTLFVWLYALLVPRPPWEKFHYLQIIGFVALISGTFIHNEFHAWVYSEIHNYQNKIRRRNYRNAQNAELRKPLVQIPEDERETVPVSVEGTESSGSQGGIDGHSRSNNGSSYLGNSLIGFRNTNYLESLWHKPAKTQPYQQLTPSEVETPNTDAINYQLEHNLEGDSPFAPHTHQQMSPFGPTESSPFASGQTEQRRQSVDKGVDKREDTQQEDQNSQQQQQLNQKDKSTSHLSQGQPSLTSVESYNPFLSNAAGDGYMSDYSEDEDGPSQQLSRRDSLEHLEPEQSQNNNANRPGPTTTNKG